MKATANVQAGVCGFVTTIIAESEDEEMVRFSFTTECQKIRGLADALQGRTFDAYDEIHTGFHGALMETVRANLSGCCAGCVVPIAAFKAMQVAARVALPRDIAISLATE